MDGKLNGLPLYQLMEMHRHVRTLKEVFPVLDPLHAIVPGSHSPSELRKTLSYLEDEDLTDFARAIAGLIDCDRIIGMTEVKLVAVGTSVQLGWPDEVAPTEDGS